MYYDRLSDLGIKLTRRNGQEKTTCPSCYDGRKNKKDKCLSVNITEGDYRCHNCGFKGNVRRVEHTREFKIYTKPSKDQYLVKPSVQDRTEAWFKKRNISKKTLNKFMIFNRQEWMPQTQKEENCICFPYFRDAELTNIKFRDAAKNFKMVKDAELIFYNLNSLNEVQHCVITEGEIDVMSVFESGFGRFPDEPEIDKNTGEVMDNVLTHKWGMVSVPNGASKGNQKLDYLDNCADWFVGMHEIILATDDDAAGLSLREELTRRLGVERCKTIKYPKEAVVETKDGKRACKDLNEVLIHFGNEAVCEILENAEFIPVDGIYYVEDVFEDMLLNFRKGITLAPTMRCGKTVDEYLRWKKGEVYLITGYGNHGKTFYWMQMMLTKSIYDGWKWAIFSPENYPANDFYDDLVEMYVGKWISSMSEDEYVHGLDFINQHIFYVYPDNDHDITTIHEKFRMLILKKGIDGVMIDPWNQLDHRQKSYQREDQYLSEQLKDIKRFALLNKIVYSIIAHPKNPDGRNADTSLPVVDMYDIAGGAMWGNKVDWIVSYYRTNFHIDKNDPNVKVFIQKVKRKRTGGKLGDFDLRLEWSKKRYVNVEGDFLCDPEHANLVRKHEQYYEPVQATLNLKPPPATEATVEIEEDDPF